MPRRAASRAVEAPMCRSPIIPRVFPVISRSPNMALSFSTRSLARVEHAYNVWNSRCRVLGLGFISFFFFYFITIVYIITWMFICVSRVLCEYCAKIQKFPPNATCAALAAVVLTIIFINNHEYHHSNQETRL